MPGTQAYVGHMNRRSDLATLPTVFCRETHANAIVRHLAATWPQAHIVSNFSALYGYANITVYLEG